MHPLVRFVFVWFFAVVFLCCFPAKWFLIKTGNFVGSFCLTIYRIQLVCGVYPHSSRYKKKAAEDDGSVAFVFFMVIISSFAGMLSVLLLMISKDTAITANPLFYPLVFREWSSHGRWCIPFIFFIMHMNIIMRIIPNRLKFWVD